MALASVGGPCNASCPLPWSRDDVPPDSGPGMRTAWLLRRFETPLTFDIAPDELACIYHDVGVRVNETNGNWERQR